MQAPLHSQQSPQRLATLRILLVRHGLSEDNQNSIWAGHKDSPLASAGVLQAKALGAALANYNLSAIYASDLKRASRTAEEILQANRSIPPPPLVQTQSLREQNFGQAEGRSWSDAEFAITTHGEDARTFRFPDGESLEEVNGRMGVSLRRYVLPRLEALRSGHEGDEPQIVIVAHGIAIAELLRVLMALHDVSVSSPWPDPRETYTRVRLENTGWTLVELAVPIEEAEEAGEGPGRKRLVYARIVQQNNTDHLRSISIGSAAGRKGSNPGAGGTGLASAVGALLAGGDGTAASTGAGSKAGNAYDAKYMMRELERAGNTATMLSGSSSTLVGSTTPSVGTTSEGMLSIPYHSSSATPTMSSPSHSATVTQSPAVVAPSPNLSLANAPSAGSDVWQAICVRILSLFNGEELKVPVEDINDSVSSHIQRTLDRSPARAMDALSKDLYALCATGLYTLNARLSMHYRDDFGFLDALTDVWTTFFTRILPWLEASFIPLQTDSTLASLSTSDDKPLSSLQTEPIDTRKVALTAFRDQVVLSWSDRILSLFCHVGEYDMDLLRLTRKRNVTSMGQEREERLLYPRLMQMTNILSSVLTSDEVQTTLDELLHALRLGHESFRAALTPHQYASLGGIPHDAAGANLDGLAATREKRNVARHGWLPKSAAKHGNRAAADGVNESAYLSSLRSPTIDDPGATTGDSTQVLEDGRGASTDNNTNEAQSAHHLDTSDDEDGLRESQSAMEALMPVFVPLQESAIGLGLPQLDQWDEGEGK